MADACDAALERGKRTTTAPLCDLERAVVDEETVREHAAPAFDAFTNVNTREELEMVANRF